MDLDWGQKWRSPRSWLGIGLAGVVVAGGMYYWLNSHSAQPIIAVATSSIERVSSLGRLEPDGEVIQVFAPTSLDGALVERLTVRHGQQIRKGEIIAFLDTYARREAAFQEAQEQVAVAQSQLRQVEAGAKIGQVQAQQFVVNRLRSELHTETATQEATIARLEAELGNAVLEEQRYQYLQAEGAISTSLYDSKQLTVDTAQKRLKQAKAELSRIRQSRQNQVAEGQATLAQIAEVRPVDVEVARTQLAKARAGVARAKAEFDLSIVRAPQDGQVLKIYTRPGELVGNRGIISLGQTQRMVAVAEVYELDVSRIREGQSATAISKNNAFPDVLHGKVVEVGLEIDKKDVLNTDPAAQFDARVVEVKVLLDKPSSHKVAGLTNLSLQVDIDIKSRSQ